jgi:predicted amidophosphoribosyltransferase
MKIFSLIQDFLAPEDKRVRKIMELPSGVMRELLPRSPVYSRDILVLFDYQNKIVRMIVKAIKYKNNQSLRKRIAGYLYEEIIEISQDVALFDGAPPLLLPMPMGKNEKRKRGFNQCEELCKEIKKLGGANISVSYNILKKIRETERQTNLGRREREQNVKNSMSAVLKSHSIFSEFNNKGATEPQNSERSIGIAKTAIVLDDVFTTGASLEESRRALTSAGFSRVIGLFIAH